MSYETAYSLENKQYYTALEANQAYHDGILKNHNSFQCSESCDFKLLCTSFNKKMSNMKRPPHFKGLPNIPHNCTDVDIKVTTGINGDSEGETYKEHDSSKIKLLINLNEGFTSTESSQKEKFNNNNTDMKVTRKTTGKRRHRTPHTITALSTLVSYYYLKDWDNNEKCIELKSGELVSLNDLFHDTSRNRRLSNNKKIYFGKANLIDKGSYYILEFQYRCWLNSADWKPSVLIGKWLLTDNPVLENRYAKISASNEDFLLFFYGKFKLNEKNNKYINFEVNNRNSEFLSNIYIKQ